MRLSDTRFEAIRTLIGEKEDSHSQGTFDLKISQDRGLTFYQTGSFAIILCNTTPSAALYELLKFPKKNSETEILHGATPTQVTEVTRPYSSSGTEEDPLQPKMEEARGNPTRPYMETAQGNQLRDTSDQAPSPFVDPRVQGRPRTEKTFINSVADHGSSSVPRQGQIDGRFPRCCFELVLFQWCVWQQKYPLQPTTAFLLTLSK